MATRIIVVAVSLVVLIAAPRLDAQFDPGEFSIAGHVADGVGAAVRDFGSLTAELVVGSAEIEKARQRFWATYPNKPGFREASAHFASLLWQKDQVYMIGFLVEGPPLFGEYEATPSIFDILAGRANRLPPQQRNFGELLFNLAGGLDGGIDQELNVWFFEWVREVRHGMGARHDKELLLFNPLRYPAALEQASHAYARYARLRDEMEFWKGPHSPLSSEDPTRFMAAVFSRLGTPFPQALQQVDLLASFIGPEAIAEAARSLRRPGEDPRRVSLDVYVRRRMALHDVLKNNVRDDVWGFIGGMYLPRDPADLPRAINQIQSLVAEHGEAHVLRAAEQVRAAPKSEGIADFVSDFSGRERKTALWWFQQLLENPGARLPTVTERPIVAMQNTALLTEIANRQIGHNFWLVGTVSGVTLRPDAAPPRFELRFVDADSVGASVFFSDLPVQAKIGERGEHVVGKRVMIASGVSATAGGFHMRIDNPALIRVVDSSVRGISALPVLAAGEPPGPPTRADLDRAAVGRVRAELERSGTCNVPEGQYSLLYSSSASRAIADMKYPWQAQLELNVSRMVTRPGLKPGQPPTPREVTAKFNGTSRQTAQIRELDWDAAKVEGAAGECVFVRVPVARRGFTVSYQAGRTQEERAFLEFPVNDRPAADRFLAAVREYVGAAEGRPVQQHKESLAPAPQRR